MAKKRVLDRFEDLDAAMREVLRRNYDDIVADPWPALALVSRTAELHELGADLMTSFIESACLGFAQEVLGPTALH